MRYRTVRWLTHTMIVASGLLLAGAVAIVVVRPMEHGHGREGNLQASTTYTGSGASAAKHQPWHPKQFAAIWECDLRATLITPKKDAPRTKEEPLIKLQLLGIAFEDAANPYAMLAGPDGRTILVTQGAEPFPGVRIRKIEPRLVEIVQHGGVQRLELPFNPNVPKPATRPDQPPPASHRTKTNATQPKPDSSFIHATHHDMSGFFKDTKLEPVGSTAGNGNIVGFRITFIAPQSPLRRVGLHPNDIVTTIDGQPVTSVSDTARLSASLSQGKHSWTIQRGDAHLTLSLASP